MGVKMHFDTAGNVENPTLVLAYKNGRKIGNIFNVDSLVFSDTLNDGSTLSFQTHKQIDNNIYRDWDKLNDFKLLWIPEWDRWFSINVELDADDETIKKVEGKSLGESELSQTNLHGIEINTEADIARDDYTIPTTFYNPEHPEASLIDRILKDKASHYTLKHVDASIMDIQRTFSFDNTTILDAFKEISEEIGCLFILSSCSDSNDRPERGIYVYDLEERCLDCGYRDVAISKCPKCGSTNIQSGYGEDTTIFVNRDNLADEITYTTDYESVKNCFKLEAGDDLMNAAIRACNPNGTDYIWLFSDSMMKDMSDELRQKVNDYDDLYAYYQTEVIIDLSSTLLNSYNALISKYSKYTEGLTTIPSYITGYPQLMNIYYDTIDMVLLLQSTLMPNITLPELTAQQQIDALVAELPTTVGTTSITGLSLSTADNIVLSYARSIIYSAFKVEIGRSTLTDTTWNGNFIVTSYSDKDDTATSRYISININDNYESYVKQRIEKILNKADQDTYGITGLFKQSDAVFKSELKKYSLNRLNSFYSSCQACIDIMIQSKTSDPNGENADVYSSLYVPYLNKLQYIQDEINVRDKEIRIVQGYYNNQGTLVTTGLQQELIKKRDEIQQILNFENFVGEELWKEFLSFRREDTYQNSNYISDGLNNAELFQNARDFIEKATKELYKSSNLQHSITSTLKNFLRMKEFSPIVDHFEVGNWIRIEIDGQIYKLRILDYEIDFEDTENISVTFSDVEKVFDGYSDLQSIYDKTNSLATSYDSLVTQSEINSNGVKKVNDWIQKGLDMTNLKIISDADFQNISWDEHGLLCREFNDILGGYNPTQLKIINDGVYLTTDGWKTARTGIGRFIYFDPKDSKYKEGYGVIADTIVSNLILSEEVGIYNEEKSIEMGKDGIIVTTNTANKNVFTIQKEYTDDDGNVFLERQLYIDDNGNIVLGGGSKISWENVVGGVDYVNNAVGKVKEDIDSFTKEVTDDVANLQSQIDGNITTWFYDYEPNTSNYPASEWKTTELKNQHLGDLFYIVNNSEKNGMCYRYALVDGAYTWIIVEDAELAKALADAAKAQDTADKKRRVFVKTPEPPYDIGDLWTQGENGDLLRCIKAKAKSESFESSDWVLATKYTDDTALNAFINGAFTQKINYLTQQADKKAETWYQETDPSVDWADDEKASHKGDLWYDTQNQKTFIYNGTDWEPTKTTPSDEVFDKIDGKAFIFISQPKPPYHEGDLWFNSVSSDIMTCVHSRETGDFVSSDWEKRNKYTDDSALKNFISNEYKDTIDSLQSQADQKAETWYQSNDPSSSWTTSELKLQHTGDLWYNTSDENTYIYDGTSWQITKSAPPQEVFDKIDGKATIYVTVPLSANTGDLLIPTADISGTSYKTGKVYKYNGTTWKEISYTDDSSLTDFINNTYTEKINYLTQQIDGKVETFRSNTDPSLNWTEEEKLVHAGDLWYDTNTQVIKVYNGSSWDESSVTDVPDEVWNQISGKAQIFTTTPTPPYNAGDLWVQGESGDIMRCKVAKVEGDTYDPSDWVKASKYTDDTVANDVSDKLNVLKEALGFSTTTITGQYVFSPNIVGGYICIGDKSGNINAEITTDGKLIAKGAEISGTIYATNGSFSGTITGSTIIGSEITTGANFSVDTNGYLTATNAKLTSATVSGDIIANTIVAKNKYDIYYDTNQTYKSTIIGGSLLGESDPNCRLLYIGIDVSPFTISQIQPYIQITKEKDSGSYITGIDMFCDQYYIYAYGDNGINLTGNLTANNFISSSDGYSSYIIPTTSETVNLGTTNCRWWHVHAQYLGTSEKPITTGYFNKVQFSDGTSMTTAGTSDGETIKNGLTIQANGTTLLSDWKGASSASINITYSDVGAASSSHTHAYLKDKDQDNFVLELRDNTSGSSGSKYIRVAPSYRDTTDPNPLNGQVSLGTSNNRWKSVHTNALYLNGTMINSFGTGLSVSNGVLSSTGGSSITSAEVTSTSTGNAGTNASASVSLSSDKTKLSFTFKIPKGDKGDTGSNGTNGTSCTHYWNGTTLYVTSASGTTSANLKGDPGPAGNGRAIISSTYGVWTDSDGSRIYPSNRSGTYSTSYNGAVVVGSATVRFGQIYTTASVNTGSDRNIKKNINVLDSRIERAYMDFKPVSYMYKTLSNGIVHDRVHYGFIAQDIELSVNKNGISNEEAGFLCVDYLDEPNEYNSDKLYSLRYGEIVSLNTHMTQKAHHRIDSQQEIINSQQEEISSLKSQNQQQQNTINQLMNQLILTQGEVSILKDKMEEITHA